MQRKTLFVIILIVTGKSVLAQYDPKAFEFLEKMSQKYKNMKSFEATLNYSMVNETEGIDEKFTGKITVQGDKFRLVLDEQEVINDGTTVWTYITSAKEVVIDRSDPNEVSPSKFYSIYKKGYKYLYLAEKQVGGKLCHVIDLVPEQKDTQFFKIRMNIIKSDNSIQSWSLFDRQGNRYQYTISKFMSNPKVHSSFFAFNPAKYPGVEVVDLR